MDKIEKVMAKVAALLNQAEHPGTDASEAEMYRAKADQLMLEYSIEEAELDRQVGTATATKIESARFVVCAANSHLSEQITSMVMTLATHFRCRVVFFGLFNKTGDIKADVVGYSSDIKFFQMMFVNLHIHLAGELEPKPDPSKTFDENVYILHEAGVKWQRIAMLLNRTYEQALAGDLKVPDGMTSSWRKAIRPSQKQPNILVPWPDGHRLINAYRRYCKEAGEHPRAIQTPVTYQRNMAQAYVERISTRLWMMREDAKSKTAGTALVLRADAVDEEYNRLFPPDTLKTRKTKQIRRDVFATLKGTEAADRAKLSTNPETEGPKSKGALDS